MKHILNEKLLQNLDVILQMEWREVAKKAGVGETTWFRIMNEESDISVRALINLCNSTHIPLRHFIVSTRKGYPLVMKLLRREDYVIPDDAYQPCYYDLDEMRRRIGPSPMQVHAKDVAAFLGCDTTNIGDRLKLKTKFKVCDYLLMCSHYKWPWDAILKDPNIIEGHQQGLKQEAPEENQGQTTGKNGIKMLMEELAALRKELSALRNDYATLKQAHNALAKRLRPYSEQPVAHRSLATGYDEEEISLPMAAESLED